MNPYSIPGLKRKEYKYCDPYAYFPDIQKIIAECYSITWNELVNFTGIRTKKQNIIYPRHLYFYYMSKTYDIPDSLKWKWLTSTIYCVDRTTVMNACQVYKDKLAVNSSLPNNLLVQHQFKYTQDDYLFTKQKILAWMEEQGLTLLVSQGK